MKLNATQERIGHGETTMIEWIDVNCSRCERNIARTPRLHHKASLEGAYSIFCFGCHYILWKEEQQ